MHKSVSTGTSTEKVFITEFLDKDLDEFSEEAQGLPTAVMLIHYYYFIAHS